MTDETDIASEVAPAAEPVQQEPVSTNSLSRAFLRLSVLNTILALAGVFTGGIALYAGLVESGEARRQTAATVWPFVQISVSNRGNDEVGYYLGVNLKNAGVGPAQVRAMRVRFRGQAVESWRDGVDMFLPDDDVQFGTNFIVNRVLTPGEEVTMFETTSAKLYPIYAEALAATDATRVEYCYCSIFDECWLADTAIEKGNPAPIETCPDFGDEAFQT